MTSLERWVNAARDMNALTALGRVVRAGADIIESHGPSLPIGATCSIERPRGDSLVAEVVGFGGGRILLAPLAPADGVEPGATVRASSLGAAPDAASLLGRVVDGLCRPLDGLATPRLGGRRAVARPGVADRSEVSKRFDTGIRVIDALLTCGRGQRLGIFAGAGVGKSTLLGMLLRNATADAVVLALVGERAREVCRFVEHELTPAARSRCIVVASTSGEPAMLRVRAALLATELADELRRGGRDVVLVMDSLTRLAMAQREIGLSTGETPTSKGYPPSVFSLLPRFVERAGSFRTGSITAFHSVLVEGDDLQDPVADAVRSLLDGHVVLSRDLAERGIFPAVDVLRSLSRLMPDLVDAEHLRAAHHVRHLLGLEREMEDLVRIGAYKRGTDGMTDAALELGARHRQWMPQPARERTSAEEARQGLLRLAATASPAVGGTP